MSEQQTTLELLFQRYPLIITIDQLAEILGCKPQSIRNEGKRFPIQPFTPAKRYRRYKLTDVASYIDSISSMALVIARSRGRPKKSVQQQAEGAQAQPIGPEGAHASGAEAARPMDDERAERESQGGRPRPSASRGRSPVVGAKRSTIQIDGRASSTDPAGASVVRPMTAQAGTRRAKAIGRVGAPAQHPIWMVERSETTTPLGLASGVQPEQGRLHVQRKGAQRLGLGTSPLFPDHGQHGEHSPCAPHRSSQCALRTGGALGHARRNA